jgi:hypothetical protein
MLMKTMMMMMTVVVMVTMMMMMMVVVMVTINQYTHNYLETFISYPMHHQIY